MPTDRPGPTVHLLAGLNGAGKTTHARTLEREAGAVRFTLDEWMLALYRLPYDDPRYADLAQRCTDVIWTTARQVLSAGVDVVLDWNLWSRDRRQAWRERAEAAGCRPVLHYLPVPLDTAIARAEGRARAGIAGAHVLNADAVRHLAALFEEPTEDEGVEICAVPGRPPGAAP